VSKKSRREMLTLRDYVDTRFSAESKAVILALETVKVAMEKDDRRLSTAIAILALVISACGVVFTIARHI
jgi:hypothetical protein